MSVTIGSARIDENKKVSGGKAGDQTQKTVPDYSGEVSMQPFYVHSKGWNVLRAKDTETALGLAAAMVTACNNKNIGYNQARRGDIIKYGTRAITPTSCDCSSLVRQCIIEASGIIPGDFTTANEVALLNKTGLFVYIELDKKQYSSFGYRTGDILVTKTKGHTAIVVDGEIIPRKYYPSLGINTTSIVAALQAVGEQDTSFSHRRRIAIANGVTGYIGSASQNLKLVNYLKSGILAYAE